MNTEKEFLDAYEKYADAVFRLCYFKTSSKDIAEDLVQDTFTKTWEYLSRDGNEIDNLRAFIFQVARNLIKDHYKRKKSIPFARFKEEYIPNLVTEEEVSSTKTEVSLTLELLHTMSDRDRELLQLRFVEELSIEEISDILEEKPNTISVRIHRAVKKFKKKYG